MESRLAADAEEMADGLLIAVLVDVGREKGLIQAKVVMQKLRQVGFRRLDGGKYFDAVAGGDDHALADAGLRGKGASGIGQIIARDGDAFAQLDGRGLVVDADEDDLAHGAPNL